MKRKKCVDYISHFVFFLFVSVCILVFATPKWKITVVGLLLRGRETVCFLYCALDPDQVVYLDSLGFRKQDTARTRQGPDSKTQLCFQLCTSSFLKKKTEKMQKLELLQYYGR